LDIHNNGKAVAGIYSHEVAEQKVTDGTEMARNNGFPLVIKAEAE
jgi:ATP-dependent Clp protease adaptor protein ClpS